MLLAAMAAIVALASCVRVKVHGAQPAAEARAPLRVATFNTSLYADDSGGLIRRLQGDSDHARKIAAVLQRVRPDLVLLNELDYDPQGRAADLFENHYLGVAQAGGGDALRYPYRYLAPVNTGVPSGLDLDGNGEVGGEGRARGNDAWGYGLHPGQYGMLVLSRFPIDASQVRTFQKLRWSRMPGALRPLDPQTGRSFYSDAVWEQLRLSSKSHWDVPVQTPRGTLHLLVSHPTPPVFDGPEDRNGRRNHDEIRLWADYIGADADTRWLCDDQGRCGGLAGDARFVIAGDLNADPDDGDSHPNAIHQLLRHPRIDDDRIPRSAGAPETAAAHGLPRRGDTRTHTGDFGPRAGTLRLDYVLPSRGLQVIDGGVFWPTQASPDAAIADGSDHRLVWVDLGF
jgi:endonuclease/exonuclease/phosphatase family metal-dependent hydrolase